MADEQDPKDQTSDVSRRDFMTTLAAGIAVAAAGANADAAAQVVESTVEIKTPDGV